MSTNLTQTAPWPAELEALVKRSRYRAHEGWRTQLIPDLLRDPADTHGAEGRGTTLVVTTEGFDTYHPEAGREYRVRHFFIVPAATYNAASWSRWLLERYMDVERHECMENFILENGPHEVLERPFSPTHGPGDDPYVVHEYAAAGAQHRRYDERADPRNATCPHGLHFGGTYCEEPGCPGAPKEPT